VKIGDFQTRSRQTASEKVAEAKAAIFTAKLSGDDEDARGTLPLRISKPMTLRRERGSLLIGVGC
jgi:hypothetical protein